MNHSFFSFPKWKTGARMLPLLALFVSCSPENKTVDYPLVETANTRLIDIARVELTDSATIIRTDAYHYPNNWIRIDAQSYLLADGKKYMLTGSEGITPDSLFWMPESGEASFTLMFEPLPANTRSFDFIESDCEDCFKLFGVDLTGKKTFDQPEGVPDELRASNGEADMPEFIFKTGTTTANVHLLYYRPELGKELRFFVEDIFGTQTEHNANINPETKEVSFSFPQYGTTNCWIDLNNSSLGTFWLAPGETTDIYVDMRSRGYYKTKDHKADNAKYPAPFQRLYTSGTYANLNNINNILYDRPSFGMNLYNGEFADYHMTSAEYAAHVVNTYKTLADSITRSTLSPLEKEHALLSLRQQALSAMDNGNYLREHNYRYENNQWDHKTEVKGIEPLKPEDAKSICTLFDINDPKLLMGRHMLDFSRAANSSFDWPQLSGNDQGFMKKLKQAIPYFGKAENATLADADIEQLKAMSSNPFFLEAVTHKQKLAEEALAAAEAKAKIEVTPNVAKEKLFDAIITPHKGKVLFVDFWNTWCGPCRAAIKDTEPLKSNELKSDELVWIYIANETSPLTKYKTMIPDIKGLHYRLNQEQWDYLCNKFKLEGIPSYVLVDKAGKYSLREDLRNHDRLKTVLIEEIAK